MRFLSALASCLSLVSAASLGKRAPTPGTLSQVSGVGPTRAGFYIYVPRKLAATPGIVVAIHYCTGTAQAYYNGSPYRTLSEQYGFIVIYPSSPHSGTCWDVSSKQTLTHEGGGDSNTIANMVKWTLNEYKADASKVFVTGTSSGAMMTNVMAAAYPDLFAAGIAYSGVPAGCFMSQSSGIAAWNNSCANGQVVATPQKWAQIVLDMYPGYNGTRPRMQIYHGSADGTIRPQNYQETMKQWAGVFGYSYDRPQATRSNDPQSGWTRTVYGERVEGVYANGVGHSVNIRGADDMKFFGFA